MPALNIKKIGIRIICVVISILMSLWMLPLSMYAEAFAESSDEFLFNGNIYYQINEFNEVMITRSRASVTEAVIPCEIDGMIVTEIKNSAFQGKTRLTKVVIPETVVNIGDYAFYQCTRLEEIFIPDSVDSIGWNVFKGTPWLQNQPEGCVIVGKGIVIGYRGESEHAAIPYGVTAIAGGTFENAKNIMSVDIPETVCDIGGLAFSGCSRLTECVIPDGVRTIGAYAFNWCKALQVVSIADSVETIGDHAFLGCSSLISLKLPNKLAIIETATFLGCTSLSKMVIPESVRDIRSQAFMECISLNEITLSRSVESVGEDAFKGCSGLQKLTVYNENCKIVDSEQTIEPCAAICALNKSSAQSYAQRYDRLFVPLVPLAGDMDQNGDIDISDATYLLSLYANTCAGNIKHISIFDMTAGDMNVNGEIDIGDATIVLRIYAWQCAGLA